MPFRPHAALWLLLLLSGAIVVSGCKGCSSDPLVKRKTDNPDIDELEKKKKEKPKEDFEFKMAVVLPNDEEEVRAFVKPAHWVTVRNLIKANNFDFQAELYSSSTDSSGRPLRVENTDFQMMSSRPAPLPKGQEKLFDTNYFVPILVPDPTDLNPNKSVWLARELRAARGGRLVAQDVRQGTVAMPAYQYYFVTLAAEPERYAFLRSMPSFAAPSSGLTELDDKLVYYRVVAPKIDRVAPLPNHMLTWSSIAYILWDDRTPAVLTASQQQALIDWLHWGGQLIISGPNSLEKLRGTYLDPYLPALPGSSIEITQSALDEVNSYWSLMDHRTNQRATLDFIPDQPLLAIELEKRAEAEFVPHAGGLLVERRVGSGRIVASAFSLTDSRWLRWKGLDNFVNGAILRRPARDYRSVDTMPDSFWADLPNHQAADARLTSTVRILSRDLGHFSDLPTRSSRSWEPGEAPSEDQSATIPGMPTARVATMPTRPNPRPFSGAADLGGPERPQVPPPIEVEQDEWHFRGFPFRFNTGMAAWNDRSGPSDAARDALRDASGISVPKGDFVLRVLAVYLVVLAPLNWLVFRLLGRVEWAWIAAPVVAMIGTFAVVRMAQLDIGFARSLTEIAIAEMHGGYPRAHLTRYTALYTSLSTSYDLEFEDDGALAQPFAASVDQAPPPSELLRPKLHEVSLRRDKKVRLTGFLVNSNTEGFVHSEQMTDMGGVIELVGPSATASQLHNGTRLVLSGVGVVRRQLDGRLESAWVGELPAKSTVPLRFEPTSHQYLSAWDEMPITLSHQVRVQQLIDELDDDDNRALSRSEVRSHEDLADQFRRLDENDDRRLDRGELLAWSRRNRSGELSLGSLIELTTRNLRLLPGEVSLVGWTAAEIPGLKVLPEASQIDRRTLFVVHLDAGRLPEPKSDRRLLSEVLVVKPENEGQSTAVPDEIEVPVKAKP